MQLLGVLALGCVNTLQLLFYNFYNPWQQKLTPSGFVYFIGCKVKKKKINLVVVCKEKKIVKEKGERRILLIILLGSLYYFIELYVKIKIKI